MFYINETSKVSGKSLIPSKRFSQYCKHNDYLILQDVRLSTVQIFFVVKIFTITSEVPFGKFIIFVMVDVLGRSIKNKIFMY